MEILERRQKMKFWGPDKAENIIGVIVIVLLAIQIIGLICLAGRTFLD